MANVTPINATIANSTAAILGGAANGLSFVPAVLEKHCRIIPDPLKRDGTFCSPYSMLAFAMLAYAAYTTAPVMAAPIKRLVVKA